MKTESYVAAGGYEKQAPDMRAQFEAEFMERNSAWAGDTFLERYSNDDYKHSEAHFAWLGYQLAKGVK